MPKHANDVAAIVLAAGGGSRLGGGKLLLPWQGLPLIAQAPRILRQTERLASVTVVLGHDADAVREALLPHTAQLPVPVAFTPNPAWREGLSTSLILGLGHALAAPNGGTVRAALFLLGDQPLVTTETVNTLIRAHHRACEADPDHPATVPVYRGERGNPVILSRRLFPSLMTLSGDTGARRILAGLGDAVLRIEVNDPGVTRDVDTPEAYAALLAEEGGNCE
jgi:Uncharacterized MobA-related protein